jgi:NAD+ diphosphatase
MLLPENPNAFGRYPLNRAAHRRKDAAGLKRERDEDRGAMIYAFNKRRPLVYESGGVTLLRGVNPYVYERLGDPGQPLIFLGEDEAEAAIFACEIADEHVGELAPDLGTFQELRPIAASMEPDKLSIVGCARALLEWHGKNRFCANCGAESVVVEAGWKRECPACKAEHFPRVDPVCIMLPVNGDRCLLGRQKIWPRGMHSALAGFIEPGETIEEAVARETLEEVGLRVREVRLHSTQPWPFPHSLMIGAICDVEESEILIDGAELESARWFTREEAQQMLAAQHPDCFCPPPFAIAHQLLKSWAAS